MAKDMVCKLCETSGEPEVGVMLISDLSGTGQLPIAIGVRCLPMWLAEMMEIFGLPPEPELSEAEKASEESPTAPQPSPESPQEPSEPEPSPTDPHPELELPTEPQSRSGPTPATSSAPSTENGSAKSASRKKAPTKTPG